MAKWIAIPLWCAVAAGCAAAIVPTAPAPSARGPQPDAVAVPSAPRAGPPDAPPPDAPAATRSAPLTSGSAPFVAAARFACDEKYSDAPCDEAPWMEATASDPGARDLFAHREGGPEGAIWNGDAPLFVIAPLAARTLRVGGTGVEGEVAHGWRWFRVPAATWRAALLPAPRRPYRSAPIRLDGAKVGEIWFAEGD